MSYYSKLSSEAYDLDKPIGHSFGDVEYYLDRLSSCKGRILEPATGTGRILVPLLEKGLNVDGFDRSTDMLNICRNHCEKRGLKPNLFEAGMESFSVDTKYEAIIVPTGTFLLLHERDKSMRALENFYKHLAHGGRLILDLFLQTDIEVGKPSTRIFQCHNDDVITLENKVVKVDYINQYIVSHGRYEKWRNGTLIETELEPFPLRWYGVEEFKLILEKVGFRDIVISSNYRFGQYPTESNETITFEAVANKK